MITSQQAKDITQQSIELFDTRMKQIEHKIMEESQKGKSTTDITITGNVDTARKIASELVKYGYKAFVRNDYGVLNEHTIIIDWT